MHCSFLYANGFEYQLLFCLMPDMEKGVISFVLLSSKECFVQKLDKQTMFKRNN